MRHCLIEAGVPLCAGLLLLSVVHPGCIRPLGDEQDNDTLSAGFENELFRAVASNRIEFKAGVQFEITEDGRTLIVSNPALAATTVLDCGCPDDECSENSSCQLDVQGTTSMCLGGCFDEAGDPCRSCAFRLATP